MKNPIRTTMLVAATALLAVSATAQPPQQQQNFSWEGMLQRHDANKDGKVTKQEFRGPEAMFERMDTNGDGAVDEKEFGARRGVSGNKSGENRLDSGSGRTMPGSQETSQADRNEAATIALVEEHEGYKHFSWVSKEHKEDWDGFILKPNGDGPFPAVIGNHAGLNSADRFVADAGKRLVLEGFVVIGSDLGHAGKETKAWKGPGASNENMIRVSTALKILKTLPYVDQSMLAMCGHSMGSFCTLGFLSREEAKDIRVAAVSGTGITTPELPHERAGDAVPKAEQAERIRTPLLIIQADDDRVVPLEHTKALKKILDKNEVPNELVVLTGVGHSGSAVGNPQHITEVFRFFKQHLDKPQQ